MWRNHRAMSLATPEAFRRDPGLVWLFYSYRRHKALQAKPNRAHFALAELARMRGRFLCLTQNVDGMFLFFHCCCRIGIFKISLALEGTIEMG
jgi:NAD-dependent deacetylase sirtuin 5